MPESLTAERFRELSASKDLAAMAAYLAEDVRWYEAGNPEAIVGRDALMQLMSAMPPDMTTDLEVVLADDDDLVAVGTAHLTAGGRPLDYRFVDHYTLRDGLVVERHAYMDAVPAEVAAVWPS